MHVVEFSGEELEQVARNDFMPVIAQTRKDFRGRLAAQGLGEAVTLTQGQTNGPVRSLRTSRMASRSSGDDLMLFCVHVAGRGHLRQHDRFAQLSAGTGVLYEARSASELVFPADSQNLLLRFSRQLLPLRTADITEGCARSMDQRSPAMRLLSGYLTQLYELAGGLTDQQRLDAGQAAVDLLVMVLRGLVPAVPEGTGPSDVLLQMMQLHVREHLADPLLTVEELARRHHVSPRHAYALFARIEITPGAYIREQRLLAAQAMLTDPRHDACGVADVAAAAGFTEPRTFERAFRRYYGMSPAGWRREHRNRAQQR